MRASLGPVRLALAAPLVVAAVGASPQAPSEAPPPDGAPLIAACEAALVLEGSPGVRFDHFGVSLSSGASWDDAAGDPDWSPDLLVGGSNLYDSNLSPPSNKLDAAALFLLPAPGDVRAAPKRWSGGYLRFEGEQRGDRFGYQVAFAGDLDGADEGRADVAIGAPRARRLADERGFSEHGALYLFVAGHFASAKPGDVLRAGDACLALTGEEAGDRFGWAIASLDFDGDGIRDLAVGAPGSLIDPLFAGRVYLIPGARLRTALAEHEPGKKLPVTAPALGARVLAGGGSSDRFGYALAALGDVNGDGKDDLAVGAPSFQFSAHDSTWLEPHPMLRPPRESIGYVAIHRGRSLDGDAGAARPADLVVRGEQPGAQFGAALSAGDMDGDGKAELVVGAPFFAVGAEPRDGEAEAAPLEQAGRAVVYSVGARPAVLATIDGDAAGQRFGASVAALGDVDGDGLGDLALGAVLGGRPVVEVEGAGPQGGARCGRVWIYRGLGVKGGLACVGEVFGEGAFDRFGTGLTSLGDLDGNGRCDLAAGSPSYPFQPGDDYGRIYVLLR